MLRSARVRPVVLTDALVRRHQSALWRYLRFLGAQAAAADDLTQEAFLTLHRSPPEDRGDAATAAWLRTVARNQFSRQSRLRGGLELVTPQELEAAWLRGEGSTNPDGGDPYRETLERCLATLTERARTALDLRYSDDSKRTQIAAALGMSEEGTKTLLRRTRDALLACIDRHLTTSSLSTDDQPAAQRNR